jgi:3-hydroxyacyl-CoA dehydrogenase
MPWDVDRLFNEFGFKLTPFEMADLAGLDIGCPSEILWCS